MQFRSERIVVVERIHSWDSIRSIKWQRHALFQFKCCSASFSQMHSVVHALPALMLFTGPISLCFCILDRMLYMHI
jgi:hypothetical protein